MYRTYLSVNTSMLAKAKLNHHKIIPKNKKKQNKTDSNTTKQIQILAQNPLFTQKNFYFKKIIKKIIYRHTYIHIYTDVCMCRYREIYCRWTLAIKPNSVSVSKSKIYSIITTIKATKKIVHLKRLTTCVRCP